jgi:hypothetical protein
MRVNMRWLVLFIVLALPGCADLTEAQFYRKTDFRTEFSRAGRPSSEWCPAVYAFDRAWHKSECEETVSGQPALGSAPPKAPVRG